MSKNKRPNPYKEANEAFLREKAQEEGMHVLDNGVMYRVLEEGHGTKCPKPCDPSPLKTKRDRQRKGANGPAHNNNKRIT